jgi:arginase
MARGNDTVTATSEKTIRIIGVPLDLGASRRGTDVGPSALRIAGLGNALRRIGHEVALEEDIPAPAMETRRSEDKKARYKPQILEVCTRLAKRVKEVMDAGEFPLVLGGDHSIAMGTVAGTAAHFREHGQHIGLIWFDAHGDMNIPGVSPSGNIHGLGFSPKVKPENVALIGVRDIDANERQIIRESGIHAFTMREIDEHGMAAVSRRAIEIVNDGTAGFHVSFDVDGCDPTVIPGSGTLVPGGVSFREAHLLMEYAADDGRLLSLEIVELNPFLDERNISAKRALELVLSAMGKSIL